MKHEIKVGTADWRPATEQDKTAAIDAIAKAHGYNRQELRRRMADEGCVFPYTDSAGRAIILRRGED